MAAQHEQFGFDQTNGRTGLYAVGVLINVMATGVLPNKQCASGWLGEIVQDCTRIVPDDRIQIAEQLKKALISEASKKQEKNSAYHPQLSLPDPLENSSGDSHFPPARSVAVSPRFVQTFP